MFIATALLYPCALAALCAGAGLAVDRASGRFLPLSLILAVGAAALVGLSQLTTYVSGLSRATPYLMLALALAGFALGASRLRELARGCVRAPCLPVTCVLVYALALAPVLAGGRASLSSYMALADSAVHIMGADYLIRHGQEYAHLDLHNSYGQFIHDYYASSYPSGGDTLFGGSAFLLGLPLIWAFQPFNAFLLAGAAGPAWLLCRRVGLHGGWAGGATLTTVLPALVYAYALIASVKELTALTMLLTLGALTVEHRRWLAARGGAIPFALVLAAGLSALGPAFGAWGLAAVVVLASILLVTRSAPAPGPLVVGAITVALAALPTWTDLGGALRVAQAIATTDNPGNLHEPLRATQALGVWLNGSYKLEPTGAALAATHVLIAVVFALALLGVARVLWLRERALAGWLALTLLASVLVSATVTTWADAKTLVLSAPLAMLLAWAGVASMLGTRRRRRGRRRGGRVSAAASLGTVGALAAVVLGGGVLASDALLYHTSDLAPTARYDELASLDRRFGGRGPALVTDFDEYAMYELRDLDVGGPDFAYPPPSVAAAAGGYGQPVDLDRIAPHALLAYPLIVTRRDPSASRPPAAYRLAWQGSYYQAWVRRAGAPAAVVHVALTGGAARQCARIGTIASRALAGSAGAPALGSSGATAAAAGATAGATGGQGELVAAQAPELVRVPLARARHPRRWGHEREGLVMSHPGTLSASFTVSHGGSWDVWVQGQIMPTVEMAVDGRAREAISGQLDGNSLVPDTVPPVTVRLTAGEHSLSLTRTGFSLAPGEGGQAVLDAIFLTPANTDPEGPLRVASPADWRSLCGRRYQWLELLPSVGQRR